MGVSRSEALASTRKSGGSAAAWGLSRSLRLCLNLKMLFRIGLCCTSRLERRGCRDWEPWRWVGCGENGGVARSGRGEFFRSLDKIMVVWSFLRAETAIVFICWFTSVGMHYAHTLRLGYAREQDERITIRKYEKRAFSWWNKYNIYNVDARKAQRWTNLNNELRENLVEVEEVLGILDDKPKHIWTGPVAFVLGRVKSKVSENSYKTQTPILSISHALEKLHPSLALSNNQRM